jgi:hypothetical protein
MKTLFFSLFLFAASYARAQYYYTDIMDARAQGQKMKTYMANRVKSVTATGYDKQGVKTGDFNEWQEVDATLRQLRVATRNGQQVSRQTYQFDDNFKLLSIKDSSLYIIGTTVYAYDAKGNILTIKTNSQDKDSLTEFSDTEERQWYYTAAGKPERMLRIINGRDSTEYRFTIDEKGNVADEQLFRRGTGIDAIYYYYDDDNRLTDIVRYDKKVKRLLPDVMFEYDSDNRVIQRITTLSTRTPDYVIWRYLFDDKGLKTKEALFDKQKELTGRIDYLYTLGQ